MTPLKIDQRCMERIQDLAARIEGLSIAIHENANGVIDDLRFLAIQAVADSIGSAADEITNCIGERDLPTREHTVKEKGKPTVYVAVSFAGSSGGISTRQQ